MPNHVVLTRDWGFLARGTVLTKSVHGWWFVELTPSEWAANGMEPSIVKVKPETVESRPDAFKPWSDA